MVSTVNPPPVPRIPSAFLKDAETRGYFTQLGRILLQLYLNTDNGPDSLGDVSTRLAAAEAAISLLQTELDAAELAITANADDIAVLQALTDITYYTVSSAHTVSGNEFIEATDTLTITLDSTPTDRQFISVYHNAGAGKRVSITDGTGTDIMLVDQSVISYSYSDDFGQWVRGG